MPWPLRRDHLYLTPGDSALGLRLPVRSLPAAADQARETPPVVDHFAPPQPLMPRHWYRQAPSLRETPPAATRTAAVEDSLVRTALCTEVRDSRLHVFLPPLTNLADYIELIHAIEASAAELQVLS